MGTRARRQLIGVCAAVILFAAGALFARAASTVGTAPSAEQPRQNMTAIVVRSGDTLWSIASRHVQREADVRRVIYEIRKANALRDVTLRPGQVILIPESKG